METLPGVHNTKSIIMYVKLVTTKSPL